MAGSKKWFVYTSDTGTDFALNLDESNTESVNGSAQDYVDGLAITNAVPRNIKVREIFYSNVARTRTIRCVGLTQAVYNGVISGGVPTISDPLSGATLSLVRANGERRRIPFAFDSGLNDGDAT
jgi:hypothetical protein